MDNLITLIFIIIAVLSLLGKLKSKKRARHGSPGAKGWIAKINDFLADLQRQIEDQNNGSRSGSSRWDELSEGPQRTANRDDGADEYSLSDIELEDVPAPRPVPKKPQVQPPVSRLEEPQAGVDVTADAPPVPVLTRKKVPVFLQSVNRNDLRKAVIWSEIIGPPVALRDMSATNDRPGYR